MTKNCASSTIIRLFYVHTICKHVLIEKICMGYIFESTEVRTLVCNRYSEYSSHTHPRILVYPLHTRTHPHIPGHTRSHLLTPAHTRAHPRIPVHTSAYPRIPTHTRDILNRVLKFELDLNWECPKKSFWKKEFVHSTKADTAFSNGRAVWRMHISRLPYL